ncbi:hypothetical protein [Alloalcanivorax xenomutans]|uniref:Lipoprotein n=1 Tax=Alloalcanivorax xenomutans TaxID=1094342 RepID=A0A9Q3W326_9GAMM|nr:hypothetical protein [Alloalcanivorax xenomutans]MCE7507715.1 hypothetical protein [Alloalcanivorax xenomutans]MCE7523568.1 hypothetical protein [Alloalcanivorax xenomutans]
MRILFFTFLLFALGLSGCQNITQTSSPPRLLAEDPDWDVHRFRTPKTLAGLEADGEITAPRRRQWRYRLPAPAGERVTVTVVPMPGGWERMSPRRAVSGRYGQLRQRRLDHLMQRPDLSLTVDEERLFDLEGHATASSRWHWLDNNGNRRDQALLLMHMGDHFLLFEGYSRDQNSRWLLLLLKRAQAEFRAAQTKPHRHVNTRSQ